MTVGWRRSGRSLVKLHDSNREAEGLLMSHLKRYIIPVAGFVIAAFVVAGCQSVATTSAKLRNQEGNYELAIDLAKQALADNPNDAEAYFQLGVSYSELDSVALAYDCFVKSMELDPKKEKDAQNNIQHNFAKHYKLGQSAYKRDDYQTAVDEFVLATRSDPTQSIGYYNLGVSYYSMGKEVDPKYFDDAIVALDKVLDLSNPSDANYVNALGFAGKALAAVGREEEARERFERLIEEDPTNYEVIENIGNELLNARKWKGAAIFLTMAADARAKIGAEDFTVYYNIGVAYYQMRDEDPEAVDKAIMYYQEALDIQPDEPQTVFNITVAYISKEDWRSAIDWAEKYANLKPNDSRGWQLLARCYSETGEMEKAKEALKRFEMLTEQGG
jgi:tetratricopeptide (TPR) repeat protein